METCFLHQIIWTLCRVGGCKWTSSHNPQPHTCTPAPASPSSPRFFVRLFRQSSLALAQRIDSAGGGGGGGGARGTQGRVHLPVWAGVPESMHVRAWASVQAWDWNCVCANVGVSVSSRGFVIVCACDIITPVYQPVSVWTPKCASFVGVKRVPVMCAILIVRFSFCEALSGSVI